LGVDALLRRRLSIAVALFLSGLGAERFSRADEKAAAATLKDAARRIVRELGERVRSYEGDAKARPFETLSLREQLAAWKRKPSAVAKAEKTIASTWPQKTPRAQSDGAKRPPILLDVRGFYDHMTNGESARVGGEVISYASVFDGLALALLTRFEKRRDTGLYGSGLFTARMAREFYALFGVGVGTGAEFFPSVRLDLGFRWALPWWPKLQLAIDTGQIFWPRNAAGEERRQEVYSPGVILWLTPVILELRWNHNIAHPGPRSSNTFAATLLWGAEGRHWLIARFAFGDVNWFDATDPVRDAFRVIEAALAFRLWLTPRYGFIVQASATDLANVATRISGDGAIFLNF
jgi:YaiO family outer membrane protein